MPPTLQIALGIAVIAGAIFGYFKYESSRLDRLDEQERAEQERKSAVG